jgi:hypothetical protein
MTGRYAPHRDRVARQADATEAVFNRRYPRRLEAIRADAIAEITSWGEPVIRFTDAPVDSGCDLAGSYTAPPEGRPEIRVVRSGSRRRHQFTALHELGHHLQQTDPATASVLAAEPPGDRQLEEAACDDFAAGVLLPDHLMDAYIPAAGPAAREVINLFAGSTASRSACCVRAAQRLRSPGHVLLLDDSGSLLFASSVGYPRPRSGSDQRGCALVSRALAGVSARSDEARLVYAGGTWLGEPLFGDAAWDGPYLFAALTVDQVPWGRLAVRSPGPAMIGTWWECPNPNCEASFLARGDRCPRCGGFRCPDCGQCACAADAPVTICTRCFTALSVAERARGLTRHDECP